jgi:hypothetical protein
VIAFHEILGQVLPVGVPDRLVGEEKIALFIVVIVQDRIELAQLRGQGRGSAVKVDEDEIAPDFAMQLRQAAFFGVEGLHLFHQGRGL